MTNRSRQRRRKPGTGSDRTCLEVNTFTRTLFLCPSRTVIGDRRDVKQVCARGVTDANLTWYLYLKGARGWLYPPVHIWRALSARGTWLERISSRLHTDTETAGLRPLVWLASRPFLRHGWVLCSEGFTACMCVCAVLKGKCHRPAAQTEEGVNVGVFGFFSFF